MIVTPVPHGLDLAPPDKKRSKGLHISDLYNGLYQELDPARYRKDSAPDPVVLAIGLALEQYTERILLSSGIDAQRPGEFRTPDEYDIAFSPDLIICNGVMRGGEIKATNMSSREMPIERAEGVPPKFEKYVTQMKVYGHNLEIAFWRLYVWFLKGEYKSKDSDGYLAKLLAWDFEFSKQEMAEEYAMLINYGKHKGLLK